jgi:hypothetical protein
MPEFETSPLTSVPNSLNLPPTRATSRRTAPKTKIPMVSDVGIGSSPGFDRSREAESGTGAIVFAPRFRVGGARRRKPSATNERLWMHIDARVEV